MRSTFYKKFSQKKTYINKEFIEKLLAKHELKLLSPVPKTKQDICEWECKKGHKFSASIITIDKTYKCYECITRDYNVSITISMIRMVFEKLTNYPFIESSVTNPNTNKSLKVHGLSADLKLAFHYQGPQDSIFIHGYHKSSDDINKRQSLYKIRSTILMEKGITLIIIPYLITNTNLLEFIINALNNKFKLQLDNVNDINKQIIDMTILESKNIITMD